MPPDPQNPPPAGSPPGEGPTLAELAARQDTLDGKLDQILGVLGKTERGAQGKAQDARTAELDAPTNIAEEIRAQFEERDRRERASKEAGDLASWRKDVDSALTGLKEHQPEPPARGIEKVMGWR
jgi:hypothetical protein